MQQQTNSYHHQFSIFNVKIDNLTMTDSVDRLVHHRPKDRPLVGYFVNANSLNIAFNHSKLRTQLNEADYVFADGSGVKIGAQRQGINIVENVNGTDMLPHLCRASAQADQSLYFLGAAPGVAAKAADQMLQQNRKLRIAGSHHGYIAPQDTPKLIDEINNSGADILLVGMGTPLQEAWIHTHKHKLRTGCVLAVGGLFDFYSGRIPRAPLLFRQWGFEWLWRLAQEPKAKFKRYVLGNPLFLFRLMSVK